MSIKKRITKAIKDKTDSLEKQECTLTDEELLSAFDDIENMCHKRKDMTDEEKLDKLADEFIVTENCLIANTKYRKMNKFEKSIFKAGYRKAVEE